MKVISAAAYVALLYLICCEYFATWIHRLDTVECGRRLKERWVEAPDGLGTEELKLTLPAVAHWHRLGPRGPLGKAWRGIVELSRNTWSVLMMTVGLDHRINPTLTLFT